MSQLTRTVDTHSLGAKGSMKGCSSEFCTAQKIVKILIKPTNFNRNKMWLTTLMKKMEDINSHFNMQKKYKQFTRYFKRSKQYPEMFSKTQILLLIHEFIQKKLTGAECSCCCLCRSFKWCGHFMAVFIPDVHKLYLKSPHCAAPPDSGSDVRGLVVQPLI